MSRMPVLFLGHGSPMNAIEDNAWHRGWASVAAALPRPRAILMVSAHWETKGGVALTSGDAPETIHDFFGFPQPLFDVQYPAPGAPWLAERARDLIAGSGVPVGSIVMDGQRGFDHGAWGVLLPMYPAADIPVVQLSLDRSLTPAQHLELARSLAPLRDEGVLVVGSGDIVHNLRVDFRRAGVQPWALTFNETAKTLIVTDDADALANYEALGPEALASINSAEHYLPLLYVVALRGDKDTVRFFNDDVFAAISMTSVIIDEQPLAA